MSVKIPRRRLAREIHRKNAQSPIQAGNYLPLGMANKNVN